MPGQDHCIADLALRILDQFARARGGTGNRMGRDA